MRAVFAHDHRFVSGPDGVYTNGQFPATLWQRYLQHFDTLVVIGRRRPDFRTSGLERSSAAGVTFEFAPSLSSPLRQVARRPKVQRLVRDTLRQANAVIARLPSEIGLIAVSEAGRVGLACAVELVECPWDGLWNYGTWQGKAYAPVLAARTRWAVAKGSHVIYVTRDFLQQRYPNRRGVTLACSDVEIPRTARAVLEARLARISSRSQQVVLGLIGTLRTRHKGIQTVFEAIASLRGTTPRVSFRILGSGEPEPWRAEARRFGVDELVTFDGIRPSGPPVFDWLDCIDLYLQPSFKEGLPRALLEAMSRGCPALASTCAGIPEVLESDCLIRPGDARRLADLIARAAADRAWQHRQAERNWQVAGEYSSDRLEARRHEFWATFAAHARNGIATDGSSL